MKVKKFILQNLMISGILILFFLLTSVYYNKNLDMYLHKFHEYEKYENKKVSIVNLGTSHGSYGLKYLTKESMNLALPAQTYYYDLKLLKKYSEKIAENAIIVIPVSIFSFYEENQYKINKTYIRILNKKDIKNVTLKEYVLGKYFSSIFPLKNFSEILKKYFYTTNNIKLKNNKKQFKENKKILEKVVRYHLGKDEEKIYSKKNGITDLKLLIEYINEKKWNVVLITTPFTSYYNEELEKINRDIYNEKIYKNLERLKEEVGNLNYLDYSHDIRFVNNLNYFFDYDHLNEEGAEYFTEILLNDIKKMGIGEKKDAI